jgi:hypothetical protein
MVAACQSRIKANQDGAAKTVIANKRHRQTRAYAGTQNCTGGARITMYELNDVFLCQSRREAFWDVMDSSVYLLS